MVHEIKKNSKRKKKSNSAKCAYGLRTCTECMQIVCALLLFVKTNCVAAKSSTHVSSLIFFSATLLPESFTFALYTTPYVPSPIFSSRSNLSIRSSSTAMVLQLVRGIRMSETERDRERHTHREATGKEGQLGDAVMNPCADILTVSSCNS